MKKVIFSLLFIFTTLSLFTACEKKEELHIYTWGGYLDEQLVTKFETEQNCKVVLDYFESNEALYAKLKAGARGYDLIVPTSYMTKMMYEQGMLTVLDHQKLPNIKNVDPHYLTSALDKKMKYSVPYLLSYTGIAYNKKYIEKIEPSWAVFANTSLKGRLTMLNDLREVMGAALLYLGYNPNSIDDQELQDAKNLVLQWQKNLAKFAVDDAKQGLESGEFKVIHQYNGDILQMRKENPNIEFVLPKEGIMMCCDDLAIPVTAQKKDLAYKFINFMNDPQNCAQNVKYVKFPSPNKKAMDLLDENFKKNPAITIPPAILKKSAVIEDLGENNKKYYKIWDEIKAAVH